MNDDAFPCSKSILQDLIRLHNLDPRFSVFDAKDTIGTWYDLEHRDSPQIFWDFVRIFDSELDAEFNRLSAAYWAARDNVPPVPVSSTPLP
jgi:hypothetical protein